MVDVAAVRVSVGNTSAPPPLAGTTGVECPIAMKRVQSQSRITTLKERLREAAGLVAFE